MSVGNIEKRGENKYRLTVSGGFDSEGKRIKYRKTITAKNDKEASKQLALFISEIEKGEYHNPSKFTFIEFVSKWRCDYADHNLEAKTLSRYDALLRDNITPYIGHLRLEQIKPMHLLDIYTGLTKDGIRKDGKPGGYSPKTIKHVHRLLHSIFQKAVQWQILSINPAERVQPPKVTKKEIEFYDQQLLKNLIISLSEEPIKYQMIILLAIYTGMRRSELIGLEWSDLDFEHMKIRIRQATLYVSGQGIITKNTKTVRSNRILAMTNTVKQLLLSYKTWQDQHICKMGLEWQNNNRVFTQNNGLPMHPDTISQWFPNFLRRKKLPHVTIHGLRHSNASLLIASGVDLETISRLLGHSSSITTSQIYLHSSIKAKDEAASLLDKSLKLDDAETEG